MRGRPPPGGPASRLPARESSWTKDAPQKPKITPRDWPPKPWIVGFHRRRPALRYFEAAFRRLPFEALHRLPGVERQMRRQYHIRALEKRAERTPLARRRLPAEHIETRSGDPAVPDRRRQRGLIDNGAARRIDEKGRRLCRRDLGGADHASRLRGQTRNGSTRSRIATASPANRRIFPRRQRRCPPAGLPGS